MATTSLWRVHGYIKNTVMYVQKSGKLGVSTEAQEREDANINSIEELIAYASREEATSDGDLDLVWGINCTPAHACEEMLSTQMKWCKEDGTIAYHGYQSFAEGEVTPDEAHRIGVELAQELWGEKYQVLIATHVDKPTHIHNHFVINTVSFVDGKKFHRTNDDYRAMREVSDRLCREHGLSVIRHPQRKGKNYGLWQAEKTGKLTYADTIRRDIDRAIGMSLTEREFYENLASWGYEFKFYSDSGTPLKRPSLKPKDAQKFFRFDNLGENYDVDEIADRILEHIRREEPFPEEERRRVRQYRADYPPRTKATGIAALYYYYCYELHIIVLYPKSARHVSHFMREDLIKLDRLDKQTRFLGENHFATIEDLTAYRTEAETQIEQLKDERRDLRNKLKRTIRGGDESEVLGVKEEIAGVSSEIKRLRGNLEICGMVEKRAEQTQKELDLLQKQVEERGENTDELFGRSSGTGRENVSQRR